MPSDPEILLHRYPALAELKPNIETAFDYLSTCYKKVITRPYYAETAAVLPIRTT